MRGHACSFRQCRVLARRVRGPGSCGVRRLGWCRAAQAAEAFQRLDADLAAMRHNVVQLQRALASKVRAACRQPCVVAGRVRTIRADSACGCCAVARRVRSWSGRARRWRAAAALRLRWSRGWRRPRARRGARSLRRWRTDSWPPRCGGEKRWTRCAWLQAPVQAHRCAAVRCLCAVGVAAAGQGARGGQGATGGGGGAGGSGRCRTAGRRGALAPFHAVG